MTFGQRFKQLRIEKNLTQQELAEDFNKIYGHNFAKSSISQYENDKRKPETEALKHFSLYFNVSIDYLLGVSNDRKLSVLKENDKLDDEFINAANSFFKDENITRDKKDELFKEISRLYFESLK
ncbi:helix-turn-helix domain-containing protein [Romboutsia sp. 1001713B170131_170501_G6]|uniref:helix-turn-helix domain-containing protein n=1 Tax=Romboutsia sp. 1001713B170131_170501_G6 TaxID=2787108 RepID=UPI0018AA2465|nr:helix-turn-helix transcriptional regulator [Romboutsia sp. 1001713B170131_170501_G6]